MERIAAVAGEELVFETDGGRETEFLLKATDPGEDQGENGGSGDGDNSGNGDGSGGEDGNGGDPGDGDGSGDVYKRQVLPAPDGFHRFLLPGSPGKIYQINHLDYIISGALWQGAYFLYTFPISFIRR